MPKTKKSPFRLIAILLILPLFILFVISLLATINLTPQLIQGYQIRQQDNTIEATVIKKTSDRIANQRSFRNSEKAYDTAEVTYTVEGKQYTALHTVYTPEPGETLTLYYDRSDPQTGVTEIEVQFTKFYFMPAAVISGLGIILIPTLVFAKFGPRKRIV